MRIALLSTPFIPVPPPLYGGTELIVAELQEGLVRLGHEVRLYTVGADDDGRGQRRSIYRHPVWPPDPYHELNHASWAIADLLADDQPFDVIHAHCPAAVPLARFAAVPFVCTIHHERSEPLATVYAMQRGVRFVCISNRQRQLLPELSGRADVVYHGLDPDQYPLGPGGPSAVFLGRLAREKGPHRAVEAACRAGIPLVVAGRCHAGDERWFAAELADRLHWPDVNWLGEIGLARKVPLLQHARATLFPIDWEEPFGLVMVESMLCGTPVLAFGRGSVPEIVDEGVTGWVCTDVDEMAARLRWLVGASFDRARCRSRAVDRFGRARMVDGYLRAYQRAIEPANLTEHVVDDAGERPEPSELA